MTNRNRESRSGGIFIALGAAVGVAVGGAYRQSSAGLLVGIAAGAALALVIYLRDRNR